MTAPARPVYIDTDTINRFSAYYQAADLWGVLHHQLFDGNLKDNADPSKATNPEEQELVRLYNLMSYSQRQKLRERTSPRLVGRAARNW